MGAVTIATSSKTPLGTYQITVIFTETLPGAAPALVLLPILLLPLAFARRRWTLARQLPPGLLRFRPDGRRDERWVRRRWW